MSGVKGLSGRKAKRITEYNRYVKRELERGGKLVDLIDKLVEMGLKGDREACIYVIDRIFGRPRQEIDQRVKQLNLNVTGDELAQLRRQVLLDQQKQLEQ